METVLHFESFTFPCANNLNKISIEMVGIWSWAVAGRMGLQTAYD